MIKIRPKFEIKHETKASRLILQTAKSGERFNMPRYHFHMKSKQSKIPDDSGQVLNSTWEAYLRAKEIVRKCIQYVDLDDEQWIINIANDAGEAEVVVMFPKRTPMT